ncbi:MAG TPA: hypothetical protein VIV40_08385 [Kofleriaceae bacterium]
MKLGIFIAVAMCLFTSVAFASPSLIDRAAARSRARDHAGAIELYRQAYEQDSNPMLLVRIAHEQRLAGDTRQALAYFCSYLYVNAAGELADEASTNARAIAAELGNPTQSDHDACATRPRASRAVVQPASVDMLAEVVVHKPPRITKREIAGLITLGGSLGSLGLALLEAHRIDGLRSEIAANAPGADLDALADRKDRAQLREKLFLGIGGVALVTGGILYVTGRADRKRAERAYVAPSLMKNGGSLVLGGRY